MGKIIPELKDCGVMKRVEKPILTPDDMPYDASLVFNAGVTKFNGKYVMVFRNDYGCNEEEYRNGTKKLAHTSVGVAFSDNGIDNWQVMKTPLIDSHEFEGTETKRLYDPRLTIIDGEPYLCLAMDTYHGIRGCIAKVNETFDKYEIISASAPENRNMALFPEKIDGKYVRFERPMPVYSRGRDRFDFWISKSYDLKYWGEHELVLAVENVPYANDKIGPAAPPVKTKAGWLTTFHAVDIDESRRSIPYNGWEVRGWPKRYSAGIMLLDLEDPSKVIGMCKEPILAPETYYEVEYGFRQNVIFPGGMILEDDGEVKIYYGASDTVECLATAHVDDLIALCKDKK